MTDDTFEFSDDAFSRVIDMAILVGWLAPVDHGYCFYCHQEGKVLEVVSGNDFPVQPPKCVKCFRDELHRMSQDPETMRKIFNDQ